MFSGLFDRLKNKYAVQKAVTKLKQEIKTDPMRARKFEEIVDETAIKAFFSQFNEHPYPNTKTKTYTVASGYGSKFQKKYTFTSPQLDFMAGVLAGSTSAADERVRMGRVMAYAEELIVSMSDRASIDFSGNGDKTQADCVDNTINGLSVLVLMASMGVIHYHRITGHVWRGSLFVALHYVVGVAELETGKRFILDMDYRPHGQQPLIQSYEEFTNI